MSDMSNFLVSDFPKSYFVYYLAIAPLTGPLTHNS